MVVGIMFKTAKIFHTHQLKYNMIQPSSLHFHFVVFT